MSRELVLCILASVDDKVETAQSNDVAQFGNILPRKTILVKAENRHWKSYALVTCPN
jgi:hypothetical protein